MSGRKVGRKPYLILPVLVLALAFAMWGTVRAGDPSDQFELDGNYPYQSTGLQQYDWDNVGALALDDLSNLLQKGIARRMSEQIVDLLEAVEIEAHDGQRAASQRGARDLVFEALVKRGAVGEPRHGVVMRQEPDMMFGLLAGAQVAYGNGLMDASAEVDFAQHHLDGDALAA